MPALLAKRDLFCRDPVELDHPPLARKGLVAMPRVIATFEREERSLYRRHFEDHVIDIVRRLQQSQSASGTFPGRVHYVIIFVFESVWIFPYFSFEQRPRTVIIVDGL